MNWRVLTDGAQSDLEGLTEEERAAIGSTFVAWVEAGPPRTNRRQLRGVEHFWDVLESGFEVVYFVDESVPYAAVLRIRHLP